MPVPFCRAVSFSALLDVAAILGYTMPLPSNHFVTGAHGTFSKGQMFQLPPKGWSLLYIGSKALGLSASDKHPPTIVLLLRFEKTETFTEVKDSIKSLLGIMKFQMAPSISARVKIL